MNATKEAFATWLARVALKAGYDTTPGAGGRVTLAKAMGVDPSVIGKALSGVRPHVDTQIRLAKALGVPVREMLIHSGTVEPEDLPIPGDAPPPDTKDLDLYQVARQYGVPEDKLHLFVRSVESVASAFASEVEAAKIGESPHTGGRLTAER